MADGEEVRGGMNRRVQACKEKETGWTKAKRKTFLDHLAVTSNVSRSAAAIGMHHTAPYTLRRRDPVFDIEYRAALEQGYEYLEAQLVARALGSTPDLERGVVEIPFDPSMALQVLQIRKGLSSPRRGAMPKRVPIRQVTESLRRKIDALARRLKVDL